MNKKEEFHESNRLLFTTSNKYTFGRYQFLVASVCCVILLFTGVHYYFSNVSVLHYQAAFNAGFEKGKEHALNTRDPTQELEIACATLWFTEQNKKYYESNK